MSDAGVLAHLLPVLRALPLWIFIALALTGYAALFAPPFGGIDTQTFRQQWGVWCWLVAVTFTIFSVACAIDLFVAGHRYRAERRRQRRLREYFDVYLPLYEQLSKVYIDIFIQHRPATLQDKLSNARDAGHSRRRHPIAVARAAWRKLFDKEFVRRGEVAHGGTFPIDALKAIAYSNLAISDPTLLDLIAAAHREHIEGLISGTDLTEEDIKLYDWITTEHDRLKKLIS